jgi:hypothetical protein
MTSNLVKASVNFCIAIHEYNAKITNNFDDIIRTTIEYVTSIRECAKAGLLDSEKEVIPLLAIVGEMWGTISR